MMSHNNNNNNNLASNPAGKDESQSSSGRKTSTAERPQEPTLKCPRCDSPNTKFCYYNNYSLTQPRHFCKTCRRYWTRGGALRNVPIGGGCRKNKKTLKSSPMVSGDSKDSGGSSDNDGLKFFQGISPAMDFQLGGLNIPSNNNGFFNNLSSSFGNISNMNSSGISSNPCFNFDPSAGNSAPLMGFSTKLPSYSDHQLNKQGDHGSLGFQEMGSHNMNFNLSNNVASSIESLSCINQDLHWKLQQQRLSMLFVGHPDNDHHQKENETTIDQPINIQKPQPILFQNLEINSKSESSSCGNGNGNFNNGNLSTEWLFDNSYANVAQNPAAAVTKLNEYQNNSSSSSNWSGGIQAWSDQLTRFTSLP
ncbi:hypothetical protein BUALT_Bualt04G0035200 [Buddleja alternifolia]|uniref:Dof zinc finger protein n=1 Tax=Buddleja alternifolia TaxID=168488 RepID=A0AAV6XU43_9LAMI|nr:hypothetical protein BUALT_Bualt04G0035200 [Buddleja alternifolia]